MDTTVSGETMKAVLLISHGSRSPKTKAEVVRLVRRLRRSSRTKIFKYAFLEIESPNIPSGIEQCAQQGATKIVVLLNFLNSGQHVDLDIPRIVGQARRKHPGIQFRITSAIGQHPRITKLFLDLLKTPSK